MRRERWWSLNGTWEFNHGRERSFEHPAEATWPSTIQVPYSPETELSGINDRGFYDTVWYRRMVDIPELAKGERLLLRFEAVDWAATVWVNGKQAVFHEGGYTPFHADITDALDNTGPQEIVLRVEDDPFDLAKPRGKQDWKLEPHSIWYPRTTGIWQTVWMEVVPAVHLHTLRWTCNLERWEIGLEAMVKRDHEPGLTLSVRLQAGEQVLAEDTYAVIAGEVHRRIALSDPGIDDFRNDLLWSPGRPTIIEAVLQLKNSAGEVLDTVQSYTALRSVGVQGDRFVLNGRPLTLRLVLDQGYWPQSGLTAPDDDALLQDVLLAKRMGFNGVRKHQKIESERFLYWADHMGLLVWEEMPSAYRYTTKSIQRLTREWLDVVDRDRSHPCIVTWVPFNESWGVPDLPDSPGQRHYVQSLYHLTKTLDGSRPVIGNDGWESVATDIIGIHDYDSKPERMGRRYGLEEIESHLLKRERPGGRILLLGGAQGDSQPIVLTEFGGIALSRGEGTWGYTKTETADDLLTRYRALLETVCALPALAGFCYTQFTDTYQEANGLLYADRTPKAPVEEIAPITAGPDATHDEQVETMWRERFMQQHAVARAPVPRPV